MWIRLLDSIAYVHNNQNAYHIVVEGNFSAANIPSRTCNEAMKKKLQKKIKKNEKKRKRKMVHNHNRNMNTSTCNIHSNYLTFSKFINNGVENDLINISKTLNNDDNNLWSGDNKTQCILIKSIAWSITLNIQSM